MSLEEEDYEGENEDIIRVSPESMQMQTEESEEWMILFEKHIQLSW